eukprot:215960-Chlamydomonas_euryale.AAC.1
MAAVARWRHSCCCLTRPHLGPRTGARPSPQHARGRRHRRRRRRCCFPALPRAPPTAAAAPLRHSALPQTPAAACARRSRRRRRPPPPPCRWSPRRATPARAQLPPATARAPSRRPRRPPPAPPLHTADAPRAPKRCHCRHCRRCYGRRHPDRCRRDPAWRPGPAAVTGAYVATAGGRPRARHA